MALRSLWKGALRFSLVSVPVEAFTAAEKGEGEIHFNQLHDKCHSRIRYKKTCPIHGEVPNDEIVMGYEYEKDKYVIFEPGELEKPNSDRSRSLVIDTFIPPDEIDPIYYDGRTYYLTPESQAAEQPYAVLYQAMAKMNRCGLATITLHGKEELVLLRPLDGLLTMTMLYYQSQVRKPELIREEIPQAAGPARVKAQELKLAQQLIEASTDKRFDFSNYEDQRTEHLKQLIEAKIAGKEIVQPPEEAEEVSVINLMDALRKSVKKTKGQAAKARGALADQLSGRGRRASAAKPRRRKIS